ncbi:chorismate mutase [Effusibacillus pohliae]|uniref:chorismate mutase n=1 Tax=Effusibacillus pohliae TaxID=232270 RepID=UPI00036F16FD|nr:chorismate mutase [Effusibacillus pohliae]
MIRGIRGATTVEENTETAIYEATRELLSEIISANRIQPEDIASVFATVTDDLDAAFPAMAIRTIPGWELVPMMCSREIPVPGSVSKCIRVMIHVNTNLSQAEIKHIYLGRAAGLRPDLTGKK